MKVTFLGTGEACDSNHPNTSILVEEGTNQYLLDCGFTGASPFLRQCRDKNQLTTIWISHFHGDHFFGLPQLILGLHQMGRNAPLTILAGSPARGTIERVIELAYPGFSVKLGYPLHFETVPQDTPIEQGSLLWQAAPTIHSREPFGLCLQHRNKKLYYSGDGKATSEARHLMQGCNLVIHEAYSLTDSLPTHGSIAECIQLSTELKIPQLALIHLATETRHDLQAITKILKKTAANNIFIPTENDSITL